MSHRHSRAACNLIIIILFLCIIHSEEFRTTTHRNHYQLYTKNYKINYLTMASSTLGLTLDRAPFPLVKGVLTEERFRLVVKVTTSSGKSVPQRSIRSTISTRN
jgi:hypothetical protein